MFDEIVKFCVFCFVGQSTYGLDSSQSVQPQGGFPSRACQVTFHIMSSINLNTFFFFNFHISSFLVFNLVFLISGIWCLQVISRTIYMHLCFISICVFVLCVTNLFTFSFSVMQVMP